MNIDYDSLCCFVDDFCKGFELWYKKTLITCGIKKRNRQCKMSLSEIITILFKKKYKEQQKIHDTTGAPISTIIRRHLIKLGLIKEINE